MRIVEVFCEVIDTGFFVDIELMESRMQTEFLQLFDRRSSPFFISRSQVYDSIESLAEPFDNGETDPFVPPGDLIATNKCE